MPDTRISRQRRPRWRRWLGGLLLACLALAALVVARFLWVTRDRVPGYSVAIAIDGRKAIAEPRPLRAGFGRVTINPDLSDPAQPIFLAGFSQNRRATNIHDDLRAIAMVLDDGHTRVGVVAIDAIGFFHDDVVRVRRLLSPDLGLSYVTVCSTHNHSTPDLMGLWGPDYLHTGVNERYRRQVIDGCAAALTEAVRRLEPVRVQFHEIATPPDGLVADTRRPEVFDPDVRLAWFTRAGDGSVVGSLVSWANHPETPWASNQDITADFPGYLRDALEQGVVRDSRTLLRGVGGIHVFVNGAVGGLMSTTPRVTVKDPFDGTEHQTPSHAKTRALGHQLAWRVLDRLAVSNAPMVDVLPVRVQAQTLELPLENKGFLMASMFGLIDRGHSGLFKIRSEVATLMLGDASIACIPGEIYPEIVNGGIVRAPGGDFDIEPLEIPPLRELMPGRIKFVFGLANDEVGYIIPKSEWDTHPPYLYDAHHAPYGEINSLGPDTAWRLHQVYRAQFDAIRKN
jgi:hypothetical protein